MLPIEPGTHHPLPLWRCGVPQSASGHPATWSLCQLSLPGSAPVSGWVGVVVMGGDKGQGPKEREKKLILDAFVGFSHNIIMNRSFAKIVIFHSFK